MNEADLAAIRELPGSTDAERFRSLLHSRSISKSVAQEVNKHAADSETRQAITRIERRLDDAPLYEDGWHCLHCDEWLTLSPAEQWGLLH